MEACLIVPSIPCRTEALASHTFFGNRDGSQKRSFISAIMAQNKQGKMVSSLTTSEAMRMSMLMESIAKSGMDILEHNS